MSITNVCVWELTEANLFENREHRSRFSELVNCYGNYPFFNKGICKCMYLSSWDMEHFIIILDILNSMTIDRSMNVEDMKDNGKKLEQNCNGDDRYIMQLSSCFLNEEEYRFPDEQISDEARYIIVKALKAADVIERVFEDDDNY